MKIICKSGKENSCKYQNQTFFFFLTVKFPPKGSDRMEPASVLLSVQLQENEENNASFFSDFFFFGKGKVLLNRSRK